MTCVNKSTVCFAAFALALSLVLSVHAADIFVAPEGRGEMTGADWSNARKGTLDGYSGVQQAIAAAVADGAPEVNVYFAGGDYSITNQLSLSSISVPVKLSGGYLAETDGSLDRGETATVFTRTANYVRHIYAISMADFRIEGISFKNGLLANTSAQVGASLRFASSHVTITNCTFASNRANGKSNTYSRGGAIYAGDGRLSVFQSTFTGNSTTGSNCTEYGGAICTVDADLEVDGCTFTGNLLNSSQSPIAGGAIAASGQTVTIRNSVFTGNYAYGSQNKGASYAIGGSIAVRSALRFEMSDCILENNVAYNGKDSSLKCGFYLDDVNAADGVMTSVVTRCVFNSASIGKLFSKTKSDILLNGGRLFMTNCVIAGAQGTDSTMTNAVRVARLANSNFKDLVKTSLYTPIATSEMELVNCTIADGEGVGAIAIGGDTGLVLKNCIVYGNTAAGVANAASIEYSCIQEAHDGEGNFVADPHWTGAPYYHLLTRRAGGAITNGWFGGTYDSLKTEKNSPCLDAGAPDKIRADLELHPNGKRVNLGAYGGTPWASKTLGVPPTIVSIR